MAEMKIEFTTSKFALDDDYIEDQLEMLSRRSIDAMGTLMRNTPKRGKKYKRKGKTHRASVSGQAPAVDTGRLQQSLGYDVGRMRAEIGASIGYAKHLEEGTRKMKPRPFLQPGVDKAYREFPDFMSEFLKFE